MPWQEASTMSLRLEVVTLASADGANVRNLCRRFGISPTTGYKWLARYQATGPGGLVDRSRRPRSSPSQTPAAVEQTVLALRDAHPAWGGRTLRQRLLDLGVPDVPSASTITAILARYGRLDPAAAVKHTAYQRVAHAAPNELWQVACGGTPLSWTVQRW